MSKKGQRQGPSPRTLRIRALKKARRAQTRPPIQFFRTYGHYPWENPSRRRSPRG